MPALLRKTCALAAAAFSAACGSDDAVAPITRTTGTLTVDASQSYAYVKLGEPAQQVSLGDAVSSAAWDIGFLATTVTANGGTAGPGGVLVYCVCANVNATTAALQGYTASNQLAAFDGVTTAQIPAEVQFVGDSLAPAISGWYTGTGAAVTANTGRSWIIRRGATSLTLGKLRVTSVTNASVQSAGVIGFEFALQPAVGMPFGSVVQATADVRQGPVYYDLANRTTSTATGTWDLRFSGFEIRTNGGVSGTGTIMAVPDNTTPFAAIDAAYAARAPAVAYKRDAYSGVFTSKPWYKYNITGTDNQIWPTFNVYLVRRGNAVYKVQLTSYYGTDGAARQITIRSARLR